MTHYVDIHLKPDEELTPAQLMNALYLKLHRALAQLQSQSIGVSFPKHNNEIPTLGNHLRLHGSKEVLAAFFRPDWLGHLHDYVDVSSIHAIPENIQSYRRVQRVQAKVSPERARRRAMKRLGWDEAVAAAKIPQSNAQRLTWPYVTLGSLSTKQAKFPLFIEHTEVQSVPQSGHFSSYGLSKDATIPWF